MKIIVLLICIITTDSIAYAQSYGTGSNFRSNQVGGYFNSRGTYVESYRRTSPNNSLNDNYNARGNYNPYSGRYGRGY